MRQVLVKNQPLLSAKAATGLGNIISVQDFQFLMLQIGTETSANLTVKIKGSTSDVAPDFAAAQSPSNHWTYIGYYDLATGAFVAGATGFVVTGTDDFKTLQVNASGLNFLCLDVTARSAGSVTAKLQVYDND